MLMPFHVFFLGISVRQVFPAYDFLGWYTTGSKPSMIDVDVLQQVRQPHLSMPTKHDDKLTAIPSAS